MKVISRTNTINAIKATRDVNMPMIQMSLLRNYLSNPEQAKLLLRISGKPAHYHKNSCEGYTIKLHGIL